MAKAFTVCDVQFQKFAHLKVVIEDHRLIVDHDTWQAMGNRGWIVRVPDISVMSMSLVQQRLDKSRRP
jgi:hypothetical protein